MIKVGDWVIFNDRQYAKDVLALVHEKKGTACHLQVMKDGKLHPFAIIGEQRLVPAPIVADPDPFLIDLALSTRDKKWFKTLRGTK
jgi:hypothetical protein